MILCDSSLDSLSKDYDIPIDVVREIVSNSDDLETIHVELENLYWENDL